MSLTDLEAHIYAFYIAGDAESFNATPRFWPHSELLMILEDKVAMATRRFGFKVKGKAGNVAKQLLTDLIAFGAYSDKKNDFGGTMHVFQPEPYKEFIKEKRTSDPIIREAETEGGEYWMRKFRDLTGS